MWSSIKSNQVALAGILLLVVLFAPNSQQWLRHYRPMLYSPLQRTPRRAARTYQWLRHPAGAFALGLVFVIILLNMPRVSEFIYFQF